MEKLEIVIYYDGEEESIVLKNRNTGERIKNTAILLGKPIIGIGFCNNLLEIWIDTEIEDSEIKDLYKETATKINSKQKPIINIVKELKF